MNVYKLCRKLKDGNIYPLFINKEEKFRFGETMKAGCYPTKGFAVRQGWHCCFRPLAPHLNEKLSNGEQRVWVLCETGKNSYKTYDRPESQGGMWLLADSITPVREMTYDEVRAINRRYELCKNKMSEKAYQQMTSSKKTDGSIPEEIEEAVRWMIEEKVGHNGVIRDIANDAIILCGAPIAPVDALEDEALQMGISESVVKACTNELFCKYRDMTYEQFKQDEKQPVFSYCLALGEGVRDVVVLAVENTLANLASYERLRSKAQDMLDNIKNGVLDELARLDEKGICNTR